jgi:hypothetical protein
VFLSRVSIHGDWTSKEIALLREHSSEGAAACARVLGRSVGSVKRMAQRQRISLRRPGCRSGRLLGQARGVSLKREVRETLVHGRRDELVAERMKMDAEAELCPACGYRPVRIAATGLCRSCHLERLTEHYEEITADDAAMQAAWAARQRRKAILDEMDG